MADFEHKYTRRSRHHDYYAPATYHIILKKLEGCVAFGCVAGDPRNAPGTPGCARIDRSDLGKIIHREVYELQKRYPVLQVYQYMVMPDHVHILLRVKERTSSHLGHYIKNLKDTVNGKWCLFIGVGNNGPVVFAENYTDRIIYSDRSLDLVFRYIRENPHRLAIRKMYPDFFRRVRGLRIGDRICQAYGNLFLLRNPFKDCVVVHRADSDKEHLHNRARWMGLIEDGGILVSPFISRREKEVRKEAEELGGRMIVIVNESFGDRFKPSEHDFRLCEEGRLLLISAGGNSTQELDRKACLRMNGMAQEICKENWSL